MAATGGRDRHRRGVNGVRRDVFGSCSGDGIRTRRDVFGRFSGEGGLGCCGKKRDCVAV